jgi:Tfp pilus assembly protein FimT
MTRLHCAAALPFIIAGIADVTGAQAASLRVGDTVQIVHDVEGRQPNDQAWGSKGEGDHVYENEFIRTAVASEARIVLVDRTGLSVGPITTIRIDHMAYNPDQSIKAVIVSAGAGTVRWTSGDSRDYLIRTPTATVTPIGTVFDLFVDSQRTFVILRQGRVRVCTTNQQPTCKTLSDPGEMMLATADELRGPGRGGLEPVDFANRCLSATGQNCVMNLTYSPPQAPLREPPVSTKTRRADVQPSRPRRPRVVEDSGPRRRTAYPTDDPGPNPGAIFTTAGAILGGLGGLGVRYPRPTAWARYPRPPGRPSYPTGQCYKCGSAYRVR